MPPQILTIILAVLLTSPYQGIKPVNSVVVPTVPYCELVRNPDLYAEKIVRVKVTWVYGFEWSFLYGRECMDTGKRASIKFEDEDNLCYAAKKNLRKLKHKFDNKADIVVVGKMSVGHYGSEGGYYNYQFLVTCLEDVKTISTNAP